MKNKLINFFGLLSISFIILRLNNSINWSWLWVLSPLWIPSVIFVLYAIIKAWREKDFVPCWNCKHSIPRLTSAGLRFYCSNDFCFHSESDRCKEGQEKT